MKTIKLGDFLFWKGKLAKAVATCDLPQVIIEVQEESKCPHCNGNLGKEQHSLVIQSPLFQENTAPVPTIKLNNNGKDI